MISRLNSLLLAGAFLILFWVTLHFALDGAIVAIMAWGFFLFLSAAIDKRINWLRVAKWILGGLLIAYCVFAIIGGDRNLSFLGSVFVAACFLAFDPVACWLTKPRN
jgi:hypothetical protein